MHHILKVLSVILCCVFTTQLIAECDQSFRIVRTGIQGLDDQIATKILERAGCRLELVRFKGAVPLDRRMSLLEAGQIDLIIAVNKRPEREKIANFSIAFQEELIRLWTKKDNLEKYQNLSLTELIERGVRVIGPSSGYYGPDYEALKTASHPQLVLYKDVPKGLQLMYRDRGDVLLGSEYFDEYFQEEFKESTIKLPQVIHRDGYHFMFSNKTVSQETVNLINTAITDYRNEMKTTEAEF